MAKQIIVDTVSEPQFTELNNINLIPSTSSEHVSLNTTMSHSFNIPQVNKVNIIFSNLISLASLNQICLVIYLFSLF